MIKTKVVNQVGWCGGKLRATHTLAYLLVCVATDTTRGNLASVQKKSIHLIGAHFSFNEKGIVGIPTWNPICCARAPTLSHGVKP